MGRRPVFNAETRILLSILAGESMSSTIMRTCPKEIHRLESRLSQRSI